VATDGQPVCSPRRRSQNGGSDGAAPVNAPKILSSQDRGGGCIEQLENEQGQIYYRACAHGYCRYAEDLWCAELYLSQLLAR
jgi:hypothetical protein